MKKVIKLTAIDPKRFNVEYFLGNICNHKCHYCFPGSNEGTYQWPELDVTLKNLEKIFSFFLSKANKEFIDLKLIGGEPTLWPGLQSLVSFLKERFNIKITLSTNASRTLRYWQEISQYLDDIQISVHHEYANLDHIIEVANYIYSTRQTVLSVNVLMDPYNFDKCIEIVNYLKTNSTGWMLAMSPVQFDGRTVYNDVQTNFIKDKNVRMPPQDWVEELILKNKLTGNKNANKSVATFDNGSEQIVDGHFLIVNKLNNFSGYKCNLGIDRIFINPTGLISGANDCVLFNGKLNIYQNGIDAVLNSVKIEPIICNRDLCVCSAETSLTKEIWK